jgi:hypothetical protein
MKLGAPSIRVLCGWVGKQPSSNDTDLSLLNLHPCFLLLGHDFSRAENSPERQRALQAAEKLHFYRKTHALEQGTTLVVP